MRIGVLGCGSIGRRHARNLRTQSSFQVLAYDPAPAARAQMKDNSVQCVARIEDLWEWHPDVIFVAASTQFHVELALQAARHDCHLFIEKPLSYALENIALLREECAARHLITMVACNMRFHPGPQRIKRLIEEGAIGEVIGGRLQGGSYLPAWRPGTDFRRSYSASPEWGGIILDGIHEIDLAIWYFGAARLAGAIKVDASALDLKTDGLAELLMAHKNGVVSSVHLNFVQRDYRRTAQIIGTRGTLYWDFGAQRIEHFGEDGSLQKVWPQNDNWMLNQMYEDEIAYFLRCIARGESAMNSLQEAQATLEIALAARNVPFSTTDSQ